MPSFGRKSLKQISTLHPKLQLICNRAIELHDFTVLEGYRGKEKQNKFFRKGVSGVKYPDSKHNQMPSRAMDVVPYPLDWDDIEGFKLLGTYIFRASMELGIKVKWGGHWTTLKDYPHFELDDTEV